MEVRRIKKYVILTAVMVLAVPFFWLRSEGNRPADARRGPPDPPPLHIESIKGDLCIARGEWGVNTGFYIGRDGVLAIDAKATERATKKVVNEIRKLTRKPILMVIYTHSDADCCNGRGGYPSSAEVVCSIKTRQEVEMILGTLLEMDAPIEIYRPWPTSDFLPGMTFDGQLNMSFASENIELYHFGAAHTSGDTIVCFPTERVAFIGDLAFGDRDPLIQVGKGGNSFGLVRALSFLLSYQPEIRTFIPGHAEPMDRDGLRDVVRRIEKIHAEVLSMVDRGRTLEEVKKAFGVKDVPSEERLFVWPSLAVTAYHELTDYAIKRPETRGD
jgi:glyoxylase-like metal-dependent hydrolase (beta-lactamase superfamily II)